MPELWALSAPVAEEGREPRNGDLDRDILEGVVSPLGSGSGNGAVDSRRGGLGNV